MILALMLAIAVNSIYLRRAVPNVSAVVSTGGIGVYWDKNCTKSVSTIDWGNVSVGQVKEVTVYVRNEGGAMTILVETAANWNPTGASRYLGFSWYCQNEKIEAGKTVNVTQRLSVSSDIQGISQFSFAITVEGRQYYQGDVNKDGKVDMADISIVAAAFGGVPGRPGWNPAADLNSDGTVDMVDITIGTTDFGKSNT
jgi:hypothetical protein